MNPEMYYQKYQMPISTLGQHAYNMYFTASIGELNGCYGSIRSLVYHMAQEVAHDLVDAHNELSQKEVENELEKTMREIVQLIGNDMRPEIHSGVFDGWWVSNDWKAIL